MKMRRKKKAKSSSNRMSHMQSQSLPKPAIRIMQNLSHQVIDLSKLHKTRKISLINQIV